MVTWEFYFARRRVTDFRNWAAQRGIKDYTTLAKELESIGTTVPSVTDAKLFLPVAPQPTANVEHPVVATKATNHKKVPILKEPAVDHE